MDLKLRVREIMSELQTLEKQSEQLKVKLTEVYNMMPDDFINDSTKLLVSLKYNKVLHNDFETWNSMGNLPKEILMNWLLRVFPDKHGMYGQIGKSIEDDIGERGMKQVRSFVWELESYIKYAMLRSLDEPRSLSNMKSSYTKSNVSARKYIGVYFDYLNEEILKYENGNVKFIVPDKD